MIRFITQLKSVVAQLRFCACCLAIDSVERTVDGRIIINEDLGSVAFYSMFEVRLGLLLIKLRGIHGMGQNVLERWSSVSGGTARRSLSTALQDNADDQLLQLRPEENQFLNHIDEKVRVISIIEGRHPGATLATYQMLGIEPQEERDLEFLVVKTFSFPGNLAQIRATDAEDRDSVQRMMEVIGQL